MDKEETIEERLERALLQGRWNLFDRLPSERRLAEEFGVNRGTLRVALSTLAGKGILETRRGSGTVVRALPSGARPRFGTLGDCLRAFNMFMPAVMAAGTATIPPSSILELERLLVEAGLSLRGGDMKTFIQAQVRFFSTVIRAIGNPYVEQAACRVLPDGRELSRLLQQCGLMQCEALFAQLAQLLSALRHADAQGAAAAAEGYAAALLNLQENRI